MNDGAHEPILELDPPDIPRSAVCGANASFGFGPPGAAMSPTEAWYCAEHRQAGERRWQERYCPTQGSKHSPGARHSLLKGLNPSRWDQVINQQTLLG